MVLNPRSKKSIASLSWTEWIVAVGAIGLGLSLVIYSYIVLWF